MSILLVEDDLDLAAGLRAALSKAGFAVNHVASGRDALHVVRVEPPGVVILDLGLPDMDGIDVLKKLRGYKPDLPVLLLTARDTLEDKVAGLDGGADDYLPKPFEIPELLARLRALTRRATRASSTVLEVGDVTLDTVDQRVTFRGADVELSRREYMLLRALMENVNRVQPRHRLKEKLYSWGEEIASNALDVHVYHLRKKLGSEFIRTVRGVGYTVKAS
jgi:DNA-binding response OmpR family regulator